jgi:glycosyltransferase involved in cell wall biosynthesis
MKILWFVNVPTSAMIREAGRSNEGFSGHWSEQLLRHLVGRSDLQIGVATAYPGMRQASFREAGVDYFVIPQPARLPIFSSRRRDLEACAALIKDFSPDLIHFHGSERFFGMIKASGMTDVPALLSLQGVLGPFQKAFFGALTPLEILRSIRLIELPVGYGLFWQYLDARRGAAREARMLPAMDGFLGRTEWDYAHSRMYNPEAAYHYEGRILRPPFYNSQWSLAGCERNTLIFTNASHPCRGVENMLAAVAGLRDEFPGIRLRLVGRVSTRSGYGRFLSRRVRSLGLLNHVDFLGYLDGQNMVHHMLRAHAFVISSYIENSPNSLSEAQLLGMPCVASFIGGIPTLVRDGETGLLYPVDDVPVLIEKIRRIFLDDALAIRLGNAAREVARTRHDPDTIAAQVHMAYAAMLSGRAS